MTWDDDRGPIQQPGLRLSEAEPRVSGYPAASRDQLALVSGWDDRSMLIIVVTGGITIYHLPGSRQLRTIELGWKPRLTKASDVRGSVDQLAVLRSEGD